jgi:hypothetical protein
MMILLVTILTIALTITFIGLWRSAWFREPDQPEISYAMREFNHCSGTGIGALIDIWRVRSGKQTPWLGMILILLALCLIGIFSLRAMFPSATLIVDSSWPDAAVSTPAAQNSSPPTFPGIIGVAKALERLGQLDLQQYSSMQEHEKWAYSACSAATMAEVINAYNKYHREGRQYRITDILKVEIGLGEITPELGLLRSTGIDRTVARFNFQTKWINNVSLEQLLLVANSGRPIIIGFPPERWSGGHLLVLRGGDRSSVYLADSSRLNMQKMAHKDFLKYWAGFAVIVMPQGK